MSMLSLIANKHITLWPTTRRGEGSNGKSKRPKFSSMVAKNGCGDARAPNAAHGACHHQ